MGLGAQPGPGGVRLQLLASRAPLRQHGFAWLRKRRTAPGPDRTGKAERKKKPMEVGPLAQTGNGFQDRGALLPNSCKPSLRAAAILPSVSPGIAQLFSSSRAWAREVSVALPDSMRAISRSRASPATGAMVVSSPDRETT